MLHVTRTRWGVILFLVACGMIAGAEVYKFSPAMPFVRHDLDLSLVAGGWMFSVINVTALLAGFAAGALSDIVGHRRMVCAGLVFLGAGSLLGSLAHGAGVLLASRVVEGAGFLAATIAVPGLIAAEASNRDRRFALGLWGTYSPAGAALILLAAPFVLVHFGWRALWVITAVIAFGFAALIMAYRPQVADRGSDGGAAIARMMRNFKLTLATPGPRLMALAFALYTFIYASIMAWLPSYMIEHRGLSAALAGGLTAAAIACNVAGNIFAGTLLHKGERHWALIMTAAVLMAASVITLFSVSLSDPIRYAGCLGLSFFGGMLPTAVLAAVPVIAPSGGQIGATNGLIVQGANLGSVLGPPSIALVAAKFGAWEPGRWPLLAATILIMLVAMRIRVIEGWHEQPNSVAKQKP